MGRVSHGFGPFYSDDSEILILGSFPSVKSREASFYYAHPQNRFWRVLSVCFDDALPVTTEEKCDFLRRHRLALWDVVDSCDIDGSSDASIRNVTPADIGNLCRISPIRKIILNGKTAEKYYLRYDRDVAVPAVAAPSTSPANAAFTIEMLSEEWRRALGKQ